MDYKEFKENVLREIGKKAVGADVSIEDVKKGKREARAGLMIRYPDVNICPVIYLEEYYDKMCMEGDFQKIVQEIWEKYLNYKVEKGINKDLICRWELAKEKICVRLMNYDNNKDMLEEMPYRRFLDLAVVYFLPIEIERMAKATFLVDNSCLEVWGVSREEMDKCALENYRTLYTAEVVRFVDMFNGAPVNIPEAPQEESMYEGPNYMYVITNQEFVFGAARMLFPKELEELSDKFESDLYILPSSIHELIVLPQSEGEPDSLREMVEGVNEYMVEPDERLSDNVYRYFRESGEIEIA